jgi:hypothetical protein
MDDRVIGWLALGAGGLLVLFFRPLARWRVEIWGLPADWRRLRVAQLSIILVAAFWIIIGLLYLM